MQTAPPPAPPPAIEQSLPERPRIVVGGEWRVRVERQAGPDYGVAEADRDRLLQRTTVHADVAWSPRLRTFVELADTRVFDDRPVSTAEASGFDLQSAFVQVRVGETLEITAGRQSIAFDTAQRFVSIREGPGVRRAFDGVRAIWSAGNWRVQGVATRPVRNAPEDFDDASNPAMRFNALYATRRDGSAETSAYIYDYRNEKARFAFASGREDRLTVGLRVTGRDGRFDHELEAAYQTGDVGSQRVSAWALAGVAGYTMAAPGAPRLGVEFEIGSGDRNPDDGRLETFNPLFPNGGVFDQFSLTSWSNMAMVRIGGSATPMTGLRLGASVALRSKLERADAVYLNPAAPIAGSTNSVDRGLGAVARLDLEWTVREDLIVTGQAVWSEADGALAQAGGKDSVHAFLAVKVRY